MSKGVLETRCAGNLSVEDELLVMRFMDGELTDTEEFSRATTLVTSSPTAKAALRRFQENATLSRELLDATMARIDRRLAGGIGSIDAAQGVERGFSNQVDQAHGRLSIWEQVEARIVAEEKEAFFAERRRSRAVDRITGDRITSGQSSVVASGQTSLVPGLNQLAAHSARGDAHRPGLVARLFGLRGRSRGEDVGRELWWSDLFGRFAWGASGAMVAAGVLLLLVSSPSMMNRVTSVSARFSGPGVSSGVDFVPVANLSSEGGANVTTAPSVMPASRYEVEWLRSGGRVELIEGEDRSAPVIWVRKPSGSARVSVRSSAEGSVVKVVPEKDLDEADDLAQ